MKNLKSIIVALILVVSLTLAGCNIGTSNNVAIDEQVFGDFDLQLISTTETTLERIDWTSVALNSIPSVVAITSSNLTTGASGSGSGVIMSSDGYIVNTKPMNLLLF